MSFFVPAPISTVTNQKPIYVVPGAPNNVVKIFSDGNVLFSGEPDTNEISLATSKPRVQVSGTTAASSSVLIRRYSADINGPHFIGAKSRNSDPNDLSTAIQSGDILTNFSYAGTDGSGAITGIKSAIAIAAESTWTATNNNAQIRFFTIASGSTSPSEAMRLLGSKRLLLNTTTDDGSTQCQINGSLSISSATLIKTNTNFTNGAGASVGTLNNAPAAGNPTKWIPINDNGTTRYIPAW